MKRTFFLGCMAASLLIATPVLARGGIGVGVGVGIDLGPGWRPYYAQPYGGPDYYPPPGVEYVPSPDVYYGPPAQACYAGPYMCQLAQPQPEGSPCSCPVQGTTRVFGQAGN